MSAVLIERFEDTAAVTEVYRARIRTGVVQTSAAHAPGTREHLTVLHGTAHVGEVFAPLVAGPGDHVEWAADVPHLYCAPSGDVEAILIVRHPAHAADRRHGPAE